MGVPVRVELLDTVLLPAGIVRGTGTVSTQHATRALARRVIVHEAGSEADKRRTGYSKLDWWQEAY
jgi:hypothetical protein